MQELTYKMYVRDLDVDPQLRLAPIQERLETEGKWRSVPVNYGSIASCDLSDFVKATNTLLDENPWALVENPPQSREQNPPKVKRIPQ